MRTPKAGPAAATRKASRQLCDAIDRDHGRRARDHDTEQRLLEAEGGTGARGPGRFRGCRVGEPVPRHAEHAGDDEERDDERERRVDGDRDARR